MCTLMHRHGCKTSPMNTHTLCTYRIRILHVHIIHVHTTYIEHDYTGTQKCEHTGAHISALRVTDLNILILRCIHTLTHMTTFPWALPKQILGPICHRKEDSQRWCRKNFGSWNPISGEWKRLK